MPDAVCQGEGRCGIYNYPVSLLFKYDPYAIKTYRV